MACASNEEFLPTMFCMFYRVYWVHIMVHNIGREITLPVPS